MGNICTYGKFNLIVLMKYILHLVKEIIFYTSTCCAWTSPTISFSIRKKMKEFNAKIIYYIWLYLCQSCMCMSCCWSCGCDTIMWVCFILCVCASQIVVCKNFFFFNLCHVFELSCTLHIYTHLSHARLCLFACVCEMIDSLHLHRLTAMH